MRLSVLNPGGNDREQAFPDFAGSPQARVPHPPINYHAYAACTGGSFHRSAEAIPEEQREILLVLRRDLKKCFRALEQLHQSGKRVAVTLKESGSHQVANLLEKKGNLRLFREICAEADGCVASTPELPALYEAAGGQRVRFIPTPYPVVEEAWNFGIDAKQRAGLFLGTREWDVPSRNHAAAFLVAGTLGSALTVVNLDGGPGRKRLAAVGLADLRVIEGHSAYPEYLRKMAAHRLVFQLDRSAVPGQVAGDALLCRLPCVGGDGAVERIAFPALCGHGRGPGELREIAARLLRDDAAYAAAVEDSQRLAREHLSFTSIARELTEYFDGFGR